MLYVDGPQYIHIYIGSSDLSFSLIGQQILIVDYKLTFPTGMATAILIHGFHTRGDQITK